MPDQQYRVVVDHPPVVGAGGYIPARTAASDPLNRKEATASFDWLVTEHQWTDADRAAGARVSVLAEDEYARRAAARRDPAAS